MRRCAIRRVPALVLALVLVFCTTALVRPRQVEATPASITLTGWGWCVAYGQIANVSLVLDGSRLPRDNATGIEDLYLTGTLTFNLEDRTDEFRLELRGTRVRSLFFLKQVTGGEEPLIAEFEGTWLSETDYVACEGRVAIPAPNHVAKPYFFLLRTRDAEVPSRGTGNWVANLDFVAGKVTLAVDNIADRIAASGSAIKQNLGDFMTQIAVVIREVRHLGVPYLA